MESMFSDLHLGPLLSSIIYSIIGVAIFALAFVVLDRLTDYSFHTEISEHKNIALAIIIASLFISLSNIIAAAIT